MDEPARSPMTVDRLQRALPWARGLAVVALVLLLGACFPVVTIETESPNVSTSLRVTPGRSGIIDTVRVPTPRPRGALEVVRADGTVFRIPPGHYPPPGTCRIWFPERPPGQQPAPGECDVLDRRVPAGAYLVYG